MNILRFALLGAAAGFVIYELTKKRSDGTSIVEEVIDKSPEWLERGKNYAAQAVDELTETVSTKASDVIGKVM